MKLARQEDNADRAQQRDRHPRAAARTSRENARNVAAGPRFLEEAGWSTEHDEDHEDADGKESRQLDQ